MRQRQSSWWRRAAAAVAAAALSAAGLAVTAPAYAADPPSRSTSVAVTSASADGGLKLHVTGTGYTDLPASVGGPTMGLYVAVRDVTTPNETINNDQSAALGTVWVRSVTEGAFQSDLSIATANLDKDASYEVIVWVAHGILTDTTLVGTTLLTLAADEREALFPTPKPQPKTTASVTSASVGGGLSVHVSGTGYVNLPKASTGSPAAGVYVGLRDVSVSDADIQSAGAKTAYVPAIRDGAWSTDVVAPVTKLDKGATYEIVVWVAHGDLTAATKLDTVPVALSAEEVSALFPDDPGETDPGETDPDPALDTTVAVVGASHADGLALRVTGSGYTALPAASTGSPAVGVYVALRDVTVTDAQINADNSSAAAVAFLYGKTAITDGAWNTTLTAAASSLDEDASYEILVWAAHGNLTDATKLATIAVTLTDAQRAALFATGGSGNEGQPGNEGEAPAAGTPSASVGSSTVTVGGKLSVSARGFVPGETVTATVHSEPVVIGSKAADASGAVSFTWTVPRGFVAGAHEVVLVADSGSVRVPFTVKATVTSQTPIQCTTRAVAATAGTPHLSWGVKSSFVSYVTGGIAKGTITTSGGASRVGSAFTWGVGTGTLASSGQGTVSFPGSVHFTGHDGVLDTTLSHPRVKITGAHSGVLIVDVTSTDMSGNDVAGGTVTFANLSFGSVSSSGGTATATLTAAGATSFAGFYEAGQAMDSLTVSFSGARAATTEQVCYDADGNRVNADGTPYAAAAVAGFGVNSGGHPVDEAGAGQWGWIPLGAGLLLLALTLRRGRVGSTRR